MLKYCTTAFAALLMALPPSLASAQGPAEPLAPKASRDFRSSYLGPNPTEAQAQAFHQLFPKADMIAALESVPAHGLNPKDYHLDKLKESGTSGETMALYALDGWMSAASHMAFGKLTPTSVEPDWTAKGRQADLVTHLKQALETGTVADSLNRLAPQHVAYQTLHTELTAIQSGDPDAFTIIPPGETLKRNMSGERVRLLQMRLGLEATGTFDVATEDAVRLFQQDNNLDDDGVVGPATLRSLNRSRDAMVDQLRVNLERWRWLPDDLGSKHVRVNIADFSVQAWRDGQVDRVHGAIVGRTYRKTPVFSDVIDYVVLNPWWETPASLARRDKLPQFKRDPGAVQRLGFQVLDRGGQIMDASTIDWNAIPAGTMPYRIRQAPGPLNALGQVKIMFPNPHNVYLHDTPDRGLFARRQRAFSSGCIRTQDPLVLTAWLLSDKAGWDMARINTTLETNRETRVDLASKVPVHVLYMTAVSDAAGVRYLDDIYERDAAVLAGLKQKSSSR